MKKDIVTRNGESLTVTSLGYKELIYAYKALGCRLWRTIWQSEETCKVVYDGVELDVKRKFIQADGEWFELNQQKPNCGYGYSIINY